jgi:hypothetical protein
MTALWLLAWLVPGQLVEADDFPRPLQMKVVAASVRIVNRGEKVEGSGVIVGRKAGSLYVLTTAHLVSGQGRLEIATFSAESYPQEARVYTGAEVLARTKDVRDLALIRLATDDAPPGCLPLCPERLLPFGQGADLSAREGGVGADSGQAGKDGDGPVLGGGCRTGGRKVGRCPGRSARTAHRPGQRRFQRQGVLLPRPGGPPLAEGRRVRFLARRRVASQ